MAAGSRCHSGGLGPLASQGAGSGSPGRSGGEDVPSITVSRLPHVTFALCPSLGVTRTSSDRLRKLGDPAGPGKRLVQPRSSLFIWDRNYCSETWERVYRPWAQPGGSGVRTRTGRGWSSGRGRGLDRMGAGQEVGGAGAGWGGLWASTAQPWQLGLSCAASPHWASVASLT